MVAYADGHIAVTAVGSDVTSGAGSGVSAVDNIFTDAKDAGDGSDGGQRIAGSGSARRARLK